MTEDNKTVKGTPARARAAAKEEKKDNLLDPNTAESKSERARRGTAPEAAVSDEPGVKNHVIREDLAKRNESRDEGSVVTDPADRIDPVDGAGSGTRQNDEKNASGEAQNELQKIEAEIKKLAKGLEGKSEQELRQMYQDALWAESEAKRELYILRGRVGSLASNAETDLEDKIAEVRAEGQKALLWLKALELKLFGQTKDIWNTSF